MIDLVSPYYETLSGIYRKWYQPGQFFEAPALFLIEEKPMPVLSANYDSKNNTYSYGVTMADAASFKEEQMPIYPMRVKSRERVALVKCKMRPVIVISRVADSWRDKRRKSDECFLVAPIYSFEGNSEKVSYSPAFIERVKAYTYNTFFYLPASSAPFVKESFVRFDRIQVIHKSWLEHKPLKVTSCYLVWDPSVAATLTKMCDLILDYREEKMKALGIT
ncbi:hypothetical protein ES703_36037 [subsurface metagenome]